MNKQAIPSAIFIEKNIYKNEHGVVFDKFLLSMDENGHIAKIYL